ncbi:SDR family oxidoreductase [Azospirillaceae bacterium]
MKTAFVAGASSDIGLAVCRRYVDAGWRIVAHYRAMRPEFECFLSENSHAVVSWRCDFSDLGALESALRDDPSFFTRADALIVLAACMPKTDFLSVTAQDIAATFAVNVIPGLLLMKTIGPAMVERGFGRIVHGSSIGVKFGGGKDSFCYSLSKHAQEFIPNAARKWAALNVLVNVARIGVTDTRAHAHFPQKNLDDRVQLIPAKRMATREEVAEALYWLGSEKNGYISGQTLPISGGE